MFAQKILEQSADGILADRTKKLLADICKLPGEYDLDELEELLRQSQGNIARFACLLCEWDYKRRDDGLPWETTDDRFVAATLWQQWHQLDWTAVARAIAPVVPKLRKLLESQAA